MRLSEMLDDAKASMPIISNTVANINASVKGLTDDTRKVEEGFVFVCVKGTKFDGHDAAAEMLDNGAVCVVTEHDLGLKNQVVVKNSRVFYGLLCAAWFNHPEKRMKFVGITGTNGKTTIATLVKDILTQYEHRVGFIGTTGVQIKGTPVETDDSTPTTPRVFELYDLFNRMAKEACDTVIMEVSSFALEQNRIGPARFQAAVFTNLTQDHLDYHGTMENYYDAKKKLFTDHCETAFINIDDEYGLKLYEEISCNKFSYGLHDNASIFGDQIKPDGTKTKFWITADKKSFPAQIGMIGKYNVSNAVAAAAVCSQLGLNFNKVLQGLANCKGVAGRCEVIGTDRGITVMRDYAHSPDAIENLLSDVRAYTKGRLVCLFGCGGDRDKTKRHLMGAAAEKYADYLIITSDNPRSEDPEAIIDDIISGLEFTKPYSKITDRKAAIKTAIASSSVGDMIILAGKGHEDYQIIDGDVHIQFDEKKIVRECFESYKKPRFDSRIKVTLTLNEIIEAVGGKPQDVRNFDKAIISTDIFSDTRQMKKGGVFIALKGENFDGYNYIQTAVENGAVAVITERAFQGYPCIVVRNTRKALLDLGLYFRRKFSPKVIGVTGSVGKTSTKDMIALALSGEHSVYKTEGNHNNEIGVPFTMLGLNESCTAAVMELGMSDFGEIERLSKVVRPSVCVITNIGFAHIEKLGTREGILDAKLEIIKGAEKNAPLIVNADDDMLKSLKEEYDGYRTVYTYGIENESADFRAVDIKKGDNRIFFSVLHNDALICDVSIYCMGTHNILNALASIAVAVSIGCDPVLAADMLSAYQPYSMRQDVQRRGQHRIILDCYNASPTSVESALDVLAEMTPKNAGRRVAVLGDMLELGDMSNELHERIGEYVVKKGIDILVCYGEKAKFIAKRADELGMHAGSSTDKKMVLNFMKYKLKPDDIILFKASRGVRLEEIVEEFYKDC